MLTMRNFITVLIKQNKCGPLRGPCGLWGPRRSLSRPHAYKKKDRPFLCASEPPSVSESFLFFIFNQRLQHSGTANHWHGCYQNNMAAPQIGALPSVLITPPSPPSPRGDDAISPEWKQKSSDGSDRCFLDPYQRIPPWLVWSLCQLSNERADCR